jgi:hypothetical protein
MTLKVIATLALVTIFIWGCFRLKAHARLATLRAKSLKCKPNRALLR